MSKTDKTRPLWVQLADAPMVTCVPVHDHRFGPCTLSDEVTADSAFLSWRRGKCYWGAVQHHLFNLSDGCRACTDYYHRREERRRGRREARLELRRYSGED
jgi:hypothetical protein